MTDWHRRFLNLAAHIASWSKDPNTKVGAVIVRPDKTIASTGYNGLPRGVFDDPSILFNRAVKLELTVHAEMNALLHAREPLHGYTLYVTPYQPCSRCAAAIIQAGIGHVVAGINKEDSMWQKNFELARQILEEAKIPLTCLTSSTDETVPTTWSSTES